MTARRQEIRSLHHEIETLHQEMEHEIHLRIRVKVINFTILLTFMVLGVLMVYCRADVYVATAVSGTPGLATLAIEIARRV